MSKTTSISNRLYWPRNIFNHIIKFKNELNNYKTEPLTHATESCRCKNII